MGTYSDPRNDPTLEFIGYEDDVPVWRKKPLDINPDAIGKVIGYLETGGRGYMRHHAIIVTTYNERLINDAHQKAEQIGLQVTPIVQSSTNNYHTFLVVPDGSKEGWPNSDLGDRHRSEFLIWLDEQRFKDDSTPLKWVEVQYGDDNHVTVILADSEARRRVSKKD